MSRLTGMTRPVDELGRVVIPKEIRNHFKLNSKDRIEFSIENGGFLMRPIRSICFDCGEEKASLLREYNGRMICKNCARKCQALFFSASESAR